MVAIGVYWCRKGAIVRASERLQGGYLVHVGRGSEVLDVFQGYFPCRNSVVDPVQ